MKINRNNYEEYFLLYVDNELDKAGRAAVEEFIQENPDLSIELSALQMAVLPEVEFSIDKSELFKSENPVNPANYEEYFVRYGDEELSDEEKKNTEEFVYKNPQYQQEFELILKTRLVADTTITYPEKEKLYRKEKDLKPVLYIRMVRYAAAAAIIGLVSLVAWNLLTPTGTKPVIVASVDTTISENPAKVNSEESLLPQFSEVADTGNQPEEATEKQAIVQPVQTISLSETTAETGLTAVENKDAEKSNQHFAVNNIPEKANIATTLLTPVTEEGISTVAAIKEIEPTGINPQLLVTAPQQQSSPSELAFQELPDNNKNEFRGIFRKASRIFERVTNSEATSEKSLNIASFEIALK